MDLLLAGLLMFGQLLLAVFMLALVLLAVAVIFYQIRTDVRERRLAKHYRLEQEFNNNERF